MMPMWDSVIHERLDPDRDCGSENYRLHVARYEFAKQYVHNKNVLDVACGLGYGTALLYASGARTVLGIDLDSESVCQARRLYAEPGVQFEVGNAEDLSAYNGFDTVVSFETIEHLQRPELFLKEIARVLVPNGTFIVSTPTRQQGTIEDKPRNPFHVREWSLEEFRELLSTEFSSVEIRCQYSFEKWWFPFSRTLQRFVFRAFLPKTLQEIERFPVQSGKPTHHGFRFAASYVVAVCTARSRTTL